MPKSFTLCNFFTLRCSLAVLALSLTAPQVMAGESIRNVSVATGQSAKATGQLALSGVKVVFGAVAAPFVILGMGAESTGRAIRESSGAVWDDANTPLEVSDRTVVAQPAPTVPYNNAAAAPQSPHVTDRDLASKP
jgi:hypothetical protein